MKKNFAHYRTMFIQLASFMDVNLHSSVSENFMDFMTRKIDFSVAMPTQDAMSFYANLSQNPEKLKLLGLTKSSDFLRVQTKQLWYRENADDVAPVLFDAEYDLWFSQQLNKLFDDQVLKGDFQKVQFLKAMFADLKQRIGLSMTQAV